VPCPVTRDLELGRARAYGTHVFLRLSVRAAMYRARPARDCGVCACAKERYLKETGQTTMTLAIFDIDGTLVEGSTERRFWRYLLKRGHQGPRQVVAYLAFWLRYLPKYGRDTAKKNKAYLYKLPVARIEALAERFVAEEVLPRL